ncbi:hypothetical protein VKT23_009740 [Stygiomarasmius scandens]|uniref:DUF4352 domain-containing protein n=1 Tax=Marasmiellus scandens TaxID=2682957 RepID=A0ABR1JD88_9AGAR
MATAVPAAAAIGVKEIVTIASTIVSAAGLVLKGKQASEKVTTPKTADGKKYQMEITVVNKTQFPINLGDDLTYFWTGRYADGKGPTTIDPFSKMTYCVCNTDAVLIDSGVTGGNAFRIYLDGKTYYDFAIGWTCPVVGRYKAGILEPKDGKNFAEQGYDSATEDGKAYTSTKAWLGPTEAEASSEKKDSKAITKFRLDAVPGRQPTLQSLNCCTMKTVGTVHK